MEGEYDISLLGQVRALLGSESYGCNMGALSMPYGCLKGAFGCHMGAIRVSYGYKEALKVMVKALRGTHSEPIQHPFSERLNTP